MVLWKWKQNQQPTGMNLWVTYSSCVLYKIRRSLPGQKGILNGFQHPKSENNSPHHVWDCSFQQIGKTYKRGDCQIHPYLCVCLCLSLQGQMLTWDPARPRTWDDVSVQDLSLSPTVSIFVSPLSLTHSPPWSEGLSGDTPKALATICRSNFISSLSGSSSRVTSSSQVDWIEGCRKLSFVAIWNQYRNNLFKCGTDRTVMQISHESHWGNLPIMSYSWRLQTWILSPPLAPGCTFSNAQQGVQWCQLMTSAFSFLFFRAPHSQGEFALNVFLSLDTCKEYLEKICHVFIDINSLDLHIFFSRKVLSTFYGKGNKFWKVRGLSVSGRTESRERWNHLSMVIPT